MRRDDEAPRLRAVTEDDAPKARSLRGRLLSGGLWTLAGKVVTVSVSILTNALLARLLDPGELGVYFLAFSMVNVGALLTQFGQNQAIVRLVAESMATGRSGRARAAIGSVYRFTLLGIVALGAVLLAGGGRQIAERVFSSPLLGSMTGLVVIWISVLALLLLTAEVFRGFQDLRFASIFGGATSGVLALALLGTLALTREGVDLTRVLEVMIVAVTVSLLVGLVVLARKVSTLDRSEPLRSGELRNLAGPMWITGLTSFAATQADIWILGAFRQTEDVAIYGAAARMVALVVMPLLLINLVVPPVIAEIHARGEKKRLERLLRGAATLGGVPAFLVLVTFLVAGGPILGLVYSDYYRSGAGVLALLSLGKLVVVWTGSCGIMMNMTGHQATHMRITVVSSVVTVAAALLAVRPYGPVGVAAAVAAGAAVQNLWMWFAAHGRTGIWTHVGIPRPDQIRTLLKR